MAEELVPADPDLLPIGSMIPFLRGEVTDEFLEFDGREVQGKDYPDLWETLSGAYSGISQIWEGWGGKVHLDKLTIQLPDLDRDQVVQLLWGVKYADAPDVVLAIKATRKSHE